jgi:3-deoxy-manno-octulosonate cytidylyltransferase (CMP-KDO synthetase)
MPKILALIPARMGSSRFPGKPMTELLGKPMIGHVYENVSKCKSLLDTVVATCDKEISDYIHSIGGKAVMTSNLHERASDRCAEALTVLEKQNNITYDIVVMVQGDEPMTCSEMIEESISALLLDSTVFVSNLLGKIETTDEFEDRNCIKVVCDQKLNALYFSREPIPTRSKSENIPMGKQVCVISFTRNFLLEYIKMQPTPLEIAESVDMMRVLENGYKVKMVPTNFESFSIDVDEDKKRVEKYLSQKGKNNN